MKKNILTFLICLCSLIGFGQVKETYLDDDLKEILPSDFNKDNDRSKSFDIRFDMDTLIVNVKVQRVKKGKLSQDLHDSIRKEIAIASRKGIPKNDVLIINYYPGLDYCNSTGDKARTRVAYKNYLKKLKKVEEVSQFFMYKTPEGIAEYGEQLQWIKDESGIVEKSFFPIHYPCGSYVMIDPNGNFYVRKGEYNIGEIIDLLKNKETTFKSSFQG